MRKLIAAYDDVKIYEDEKSKIKYYEVPVPEPNSSERTIINILKEAATRVMSISPYKIKDPIQRKAKYKQKVMEIIEFSESLNIPREKWDHYAEAVVREMVGYGLLDYLLKDDNLEEIMVINKDHPVYVFHRECGMCITNIRFSSEDEIKDIATKIAREVGRRVDINSPLLDARLPDGSRVNVTIPPISVDGTTITIRKFRKSPFSIIDLIKNKTLSSFAAAFLWLAVDGYGYKAANILVSGGTGGGKTTTLNVLASFIPDDERIVTIEDTAELNLFLNHWVRLESRPPNIEGEGEITMDILTKHSLRMRPDRIVVGEVRHKEAYTLFTAMNTGHDGCMGTLHANDAEETIVRVISPPMNVPEIMVSALDLIIVQNRLHTPKGLVRRVVEISEIVSKPGEKIKVRPIFKRDPLRDSLEYLGNSKYLEKLSKLSGKSVSFFEEEIKRRENYLLELKNKGIFLNKEVREKILAYQ
jgi:flagellar protein FlaI